MTSEVNKNCDNKTEVILIEIDHKGYFTRYALTPEGFAQEFEERLAEMPEPSYEGESFTFKPMVHIWYQKTKIGSPEWISFFTDMSYGLSEGDVESENFACIDYDMMGDLKKYIPKLLYEIYWDAASLKITDSYKLLVTKETEKMYYGKVFRLTEDWSFVQNFAVRKEHCDKVIYKVGPRLKYKVLTEGNTYVTAKRKAAQIICDEIKEKEYILRTKLIAKTI